MPKLHLKTFRIGTPRQRGEGLRIGTVRFLPRGVRKQDYARLDYFDLWLPSLAPSRELLSEARKAGWPIEKLLAHYRREMEATEPAQTIRLLAAIARKTPIAVGCYCKDEQQCHRSVLLDLIQAATSSS
jgi:uncharacterized protein YeaO (DUF488 family)